MNSGNVRQNVHFLIAVGVLAGSAIAIHAGKRAGWLQLIKGRAPIRRPLDDFVRSRLRPYKVVAAQKLRPEIVEELGTHEYINWTLRNDQAPLPAARLLSLSVTYYTGVQDQVPHVPEECLNVATYSLTQDDTVTIAAPALHEAASVRRLQFTPPPSEMVRGASGMTVVYYTFSVNGQFKSSRLGVRNKMLDWRDKRLYYSKVELTYYGVKESDLPALDAAVEPLMGSVLGELVESHWPIRGSERDPPGAAADGGSGPGRCRYVARGVRVCVRRHQPGRLATAEVWVVGKDGGLAD